MAHDVDLAIIGGGCAGLSLARDLAGLAGHGAKMPATWILEPRISYTHDRTWCFWTREAGPDEPLVTHRWHSWRFSDGKHCRIHSPGDGWAYHCIPAERFYCHALHAIESARNIELRRGVQVIEVQPESGRLRIDSSDGTFYAKQIVDTRPPHQAMAMQAALNQVFAGVQIRCQQPLKDPRIAGLMDNMSSDQFGFRFDYVLPMSTTTALVEATRFSKGPVPRQQLRTDLNQALQRLVPDGRYEVVRREYGAIPMGLPVALDSGNPNCVQAGTRGGAVRASTGYAYRRIQDWSRQCAKRIIDSGRAIGHPPTSRRLQWMDQLFLELLRDRPELGPRLFMALASNLQPAALVRFLTERAGIADQLAVVRALPSWPMLQHWLQRLRGSLRTRTDTATGRTQ